MSVKKKVCCRCQKKFLVTKGIVRIEENGIIFKLEKDPSMCDNCARENFLAMYDDYNLKKLVKKTKIGLKINWKYYNLHRDEELTFGPMLRLLSALNVLTTDMQKGWVILSGNGVVLNPHYGNDFYFTQRKWMVGYCQEVLGETVFYNNSYMAYHPQHRSMSSDQIMEMEL